MGSRRKSVDSSGSSGNESEDYKHKDKKDKDKGKDNGKKEKKDKDKDKDKKDKKDKDKDGKDKDKDKKDKDKDKDKKDKDKDKSKDGKEKGDSKDSKDKDKKEKSRDGKDASDTKDGYGHTVGGGYTGQSFAQAPMDQGYGQFSSPPFVPPSFEANRAVNPGDPGFPSPPSYGSNEPAAPPSGYRVPLTTTSPFPEQVVAGEPVCYDGDGVSPIFIGSALFANSVHPCKIGPHLQPFASVAYGGVEHGHEGRYDLLPFIPQTMEWVHTSYGQIPPGRRPIEGGYEETGEKLYHGLVTLNGVKVPGKTGEHLGACNVSFGGSEIAITEHEILCWR
ncbi:hypothetical protein D9615_004325 [Tricholomella constricta]|uniref:Uncharacterized protein n=1 Tax=Tricholomella constricta TaxID=117010 RepID=A0A8H5HFE3_9AGAR|nr:hypothetical protein D9615_004325 [Tricholomella constricta]